MTTRWRKWTGEELAQLRTLYPRTANCDIAAILGRTKDAVESMADSLKIKKDADFAGMLRQKRNRRQPKSDPKSAGYFSSISPALPSISPEKAMVGVWFESYNLPTRTPINGNMIVRRVKDTP